MSTLRTTNVSTASARDFIRSHLPVSTTGELVDLIVINNVLLGENWVSHSSLNVGLSAESVCMFVVTTKYFSLSLASLSLLLLILQDILVEVVEIV